MLIVAGISAVYGIYLYLLALRDDEASLVVPFWQLIPVFGYGFGWLVLGERMSGKQLAAGMVIVSAAMVLLVSSLQPAFVFLLGIAGTLLIPRFVPESLTHRDLLHKGLSIATMCAGAAMM